MKFIIENVSGYGIDVNDFKKLKAGGFLINKEGKDIERSWRPGRKYCSSTIEITDTNQIIRIMEIVECSLYFDYDQKRKDQPKILIVDDWL